MLGGTTCSTQGPSWVLLEKQSNKIHHLKCFILQHSSMPPCYEASWCNALWKAFVTSIRLVPYKSVSLLNTLCGCCGSKHLWGTPRFMATLLYVVAQCLSGSVINFSKDHIGLGVTLTDALGWRTCFPHPPWCLLCHPMVSGAVTWWISISVGFAPLTCHCVPLWCHRQTDFTQFLEMFFQQRSGRDLNLLEILFVQQNIVCIMLAHPCCWRSC